MECFNLKLRQGTKKMLWLFILFGFIFPDLLSQEIQSVKGEMIWNKAPHNAFPDIEKFNDSFFCTFREAGSHHKKNGKIRIIQSSDGEKWKSVFFEGYNDCDLRGPKLSVTSQGQLMLNAAVNYWGDNNKLKRQSVTWLSFDGEYWDGPYYCPTGVNTWRWNVAWDDSVGYSVAYTGKDKSGALYSTLDGKEWKLIKKGLFPDVKSYPNEADVAFTKDSISFCLLRRERGDQSAFLGKSTAPYEEWTWTDLGVRVGGPELKILNYGTVLAGVRLYDENRRTALCILDIEKSSLKEIYSFKSGGDTGYTGIIEVDSNIWVSYYSSHEGKSSIYLAKIPLPIN